MGISISMEISKATTKEEWSKVYSETLELIKHLPLAEKIITEIHGVECICLVPTTERKEKLGWFAHTEQYGWTAVGDYETMCTAEEYYLSRDLIDENVTNVTKQDAIWGNLPAYGNYDWKDERCNQTYGIWGAKTQGEPYHIYLLAVAVLIEARLGNKAFVHGDITRGQIKKAVEIVNEYVDEKIDLPDRCYIDKLFARINSFELEDEEKLEILDRIYLGEKDAEFGKFIKNHFGDNIKKKYWKRRFKRFKINTVGFDDCLRDYIEWGFELEELGCYLTLKNEKTKNKFDILINKIMQAELHHEQKDCSDALRIEQSREQPYTVSTVFAQIFLAGAKNPRIDRYIPLPELRIQLEKAFGSKCDVNGLIDEYLAKEQNTAEQEDPATNLKTTMEIFGERENIERQKYDICDYEDLSQYKDGDTLHPQLAKSIGASRRFLNSTLEEDNYKKLMLQDAKRKCEWLAEHNRCILIRDIDWDKVFTDIENNPDSFGRYYSLIRVEINSSKLEQLCIALFLNDDFYAVSAKLAQEVEEETENN